MTRKINLNWRKNENKSKTFSRFADSNEMYKTWNELNCYHIFENCDAIIGGPIQVSPYHVEDFNIPLCRKCQERLQPTVSRGFGESLYQYWLNV